MTRGKLTILLCFFTLLTLFSILSIYYTHQLPTQEVKTTNLCTYTHIGNYDYTAYLKSNLIYNVSELKPGQGTLYLEITEYIATTFTYTFQTDQTANITIQYNITTSLESPKWRKTLSSVNQTTQNYTETTSAEFSSNYTFDVTYIQYLKNSFDSETRLYTSNYSVTIKPQILTTAQTDAGPINELFNPTLTLVFQQGTPEGDYISTTNLQNTRPSAITQTTITNLAWATNQQYASYAFTATSLAALAITSYAFTRTQPPTKPAKPLEEIIAPYQEVIAESTGEPTYEGRTATITMKSLEDLIKVADWIGKPVLSYQKPPTQTSKESTRVFYVLDGTTRYECTITAPTITEKEEEAETENSD